MVFRSLIPAHELSAFGPGALSPFSALQTKMGREFARLFEESMRIFPLIPLMPLASMALQFDVKEDDKAFTVTTDLPGMIDKDVEIIFENDVLTIRGEKKSDFDEKIGTWHLVERSSGNFARQLSIPVAINEDQIEATFNNGVLTITLPKKPNEDSKAKKISIKNS